MDDMPAELVALSVARQHAAQAREAAERAFHQAVIAEAELALQEERAVAAAATADRERLVARLHVAEIFTQMATHTVEMLQLKIASTASTRMQAEARASALRAALLEHEEQIRVAEEAERKLLGDLANVELAGEACRGARDTAQAALGGVLQLGPSPVASFAARAAERRKADRRGGGPMEQTHQLAM